jgi:hypothetical protein
MLKSPQPPSYRPPKDPDANWIVRHPALTVALVIAAIIVLVAVGAAMGDPSSSPEAQAAPDPTEEALEIQERQAKEVEEAAREAAKAIRKLEKDVAKALRSHAHKDIEVQSRMSVPIVEGQWEIVANFVAVRVDTKSIEMSMMEAYKKVYTSDVPVNRVALVAHGELLDGYGNEIVAIIYTTEMGKGVGRRINWENYRQLTPSRVMTTTYKHRLLE